MGIYSLLFITIKKDGQMELFYIALIILAMLIVGLIINEIVEKVSHVSDRDYLESQSQRIKYQHRKNSNVIELWEKDSTDKDFVHTGSVEITTNLILPLNKCAKSTTLTRLLEISGKISNGEYVYRKQPNLSDFDSLKRDARKILNEFHGLVLSSPLGLQGKLDNDLISAVINVCEESINEPKYVQNYSKIIESYGSVELQIYDWIGGALAIMYEEDVTEQEEYTIDVLLEMVNDKLKSLGAKTFFSKEYPLGTDVYPG